MRGWKFEEEGDGKRKMFYFSFDNKEEMFIRSTLGGSEREGMRERASDMVAELAVYNSLLNIY
jgi:hypothetical protein